MDLVRNTVLDIGANLGEFGLEVAMRCPDAVVHLVEPATDLSEKLAETIKSNHLKNAVLHTFAISEFDGQAKLGIAVKGDRGASSLLAFDENRIRSDPYWSSRSDLAHDHHVVVETVRLDTLIRKLGITRVDFIKIDVQGLDLAVLKSAGEYLLQIQAGMLEVPATPNHALYEGETQDLRSALNFLRTSGFDVVAIKPNDPSSNEFNVFFTRDLRGWSDLLQNLKLNGLHIFDGKNYWHEPSSSPVYADELHLRYIRENERLIRRIEVMDMENARLDKENARLDKENARIGSKIEFVMRIGVLGLLAFALLLFVLR